LRMCPVLGCAETASLPVANIAASQNASKSRFAMRDAKTATGREGNFCQKEPPLLQKAALAKAPSSCSRSSSPINQNLKISFLYIHRTCLLAAVQKLGNSCVYCYW
ncbi:MAG: hypothetical protein IJY16_00005, partial [Clostridia bacterium]|nr:hypothetical protein [Clostridia bacterium]